MTSLSSDVGSHNDRYRHYESMDNSSMGNSNDRGTKWLIGSATCCFASLALSIGEIKLIEDCNKLAVSVGVAMFATAFFGIVGAGIFSLVRYQECGGCSIQKANRTDFVSLASLIAAVTGIAIFVVFGRNSNCHPASS